MKSFTTSIRAKFTLLFISILCLSCLVSLTFMIVAAYHFHRLGTISHQGSMVFLLTATVVLCVVIGSILMIFASKHFTGPIKLISDSTKVVAKGNFDVEIQYKSEDEIGILAKNFNLMTQELRSMEYLRKDFISNVSHEFKTPIVSIQGFAEMIKDENLPRDKFEEYTDIIIQESRRLNNLSANMLRLSKLDYQVIPDKKVIFSLDEQIRKTLLLLEEHWSAKSIHLDIDLAKVNYEGDEDLIQQIWINLIGNAIKFSHPEGTLTITLQKSPDSVRVVIKDEGIGMAQEIQPHIFEKFYKSDTSRSEVGNGLGLAIVKRIVEICQGTLSFASEESLGTSFQVTLPKAASVSPPKLI
ncbi:signal transduction histidine kinase [Desulfitobacterium dichloroeliminans LMG P-21439]|uniref:Heme sensor protein HssS n=1 Tax=Desulfitobacterium dichloroeliminans (strain LMG P-21439 / DCA1) TaxID=871963 RepID=L0F3Z9_DESDL|nr:HAMP domain-containing sensor histidine kinase [Desulfitobacterium dichloroeliminans]AGA67902.1 signal transduction histidine kinase [Desulfitobacterium dichloroeliminans LMG P-21439]